VITSQEAVIRLVIALLFGAMVGIERETHGRSAGLRTHALVSVAMCLLMVMSELIPQEFISTGWAGYLRIDPARLGAGALAGMGFIGAGVVLKGRGSIRGVTTAASLWTMSAVGLATGMGQYLLAAVTSGLALVVLHGMRSRQLARILSRDNYTRLHLSGPRLSQRLPAIEAALASFGADILFVSVTHNVVVDSMTYRFALRFPRPPEWKRLTEEVARIPGVERMIWLQGLVP
jgi:putative Mg2+ transporter-C (MgtC) family protein